MVNTTRMRWLLLGTSATLLAVTTAGAQATGSGIPVSKDRAPAVSSTTSGMSMGEVALGENASSIHANDLALARSATDPQIMHALIVGDSLEVAFGQLALHHSSNADIRALAQAVVTDHGAALAEEREMAVDEDIGRQPIPGMQGPAHMVRVYNSMSSMSPGMAWDRAWLQHQIMHHRQELEMLNAFEPNARDDDLEQQIQRKRPVVQGHLNQLVALANRWGMNTTDMSGMQHNTSGNMQQHQGMQHNPNTSGTPNVRMNTNTDTTGMGTRTNTNTGTGTGTRPPNY